MLGRGQRGTGVKSTFAGRSWAIDFPSSSQAARQWLHHVPRVFSPRANSRPAMFSVLPRLRPLFFRPRRLPRPPAVRSMASTHPRSRSTSPTAVSAPPEKKPRLDVSPESAEPVQIQDAPADYQAPPSASTSKKHAKNKKNKRNQRRVPEPFSSDDILTREVIALLGPDYVQTVVDENLDWDAPVEQFTQLELTVACISPSTGPFTSYRGMPSTTSLCIFPV